MIKKTSKTAEGRLFIVAGERRWQAAGQIGLTTLPAIFVQGNHAEIALVENLQRQDLTSVEEAEALDRLTFLSPQILCLREFK